MELYEWGDMLNFPITIIFILLVVVHVLKLSKIIENILAVLFCLAITFMFILSFWYNWLGKTIIIIILSLGILVLFFACIGFIEEILKKIKKLF